jgi:NAD(P)H-hydrate repair Nnr-like enzyme with NAD(P)H-hydrate epimerase domain
MVWSVQGISNNLYYYILSQFPIERIFKGFNTKVLLPKAPTSDLMNRLVQQCLQMEIPQITAIGSSSENLASEYDLIVDAIFGFSCMMLVPK